VENFQFLLDLAQRLEHEDRCRLCGMLADLVYPKPAEGFTVDIVFECKEKFTDWLGQQIGLS